MNLFKHIIPTLFVGALFAACDRDIENVDVDVVQPYTYSPLYYQNLRDYKASDHSIAWGWFADYTQKNSLATSFLGLPDSLDICSLWGGIPTQDSTLADATTCRRWRRRCDSCSIRKARSSLCRPSCASATSRCSTIPSGWPRKIPIRPCRSSPNTSSPRSRSTTLTA
ncbi:glycoside hydrolase family 18 [Segatella baroniae]|uniref:glycoside hydrolase family 18 n=1 Tax=Segatella baroniae TaxID=305719 RepID=UPI0009DDB3E3|nr:glycoside hydrolase family 18 [Segatella baroniae]